MNEAIQLFAESAKTSIGFFWKSGWAFVLGYTISAMIQAFVPKKKLTKRMGDANLKGVSLSTIFGAISSSCSFAALATARSLFKKGAHFINTVAFMFASTNLVIELGILIFIFLGVEFVVAEIIGGLVLITISSLLISLTFPKKWIDKAREKVKTEGEEEDDFNWKKRITSKEGWYRVGQKFVMEWKMAYEDIIIGFTIAGFVAVLVPNSFWESIFLADMKDQLHPALIAVENAMVAPFVAAATFIGSMGNIPLATVLNENGVLFAGIMGFIYSDLMVPPLVNINRKYYGKRIALYIAGIMYVSIVFTALILNSGFTVANAIPESSQEVAKVTQFAIDYTFWFNVVFAIVVIAMIFLHRKFQSVMSSHGGHHHHSSSTFKMVIVYSCVIIVGVGGLVYLFQEVI